MQRVFKSPLRFYAHGYPKGKYRRMSGVQVEEEKEG